MNAETVVPFERPAFFGEGLPPRSEITVEPIGATWCVGIRLPSGRYDPHWRPTYTFLESEALMAALIISAQTGLTIRQHDRAPDLPPEAA